MNSGQNSVVEPDVLDDTLVLNDTGYLAFRPVFAGSFDHSSLTITVTFSGSWNGTERWYDPITGRWLSNDPIGINGGLNQYVFCENNPVNETDAFGLCVDDDGAPVYLDASRGARMLRAWNSLRKTHSWKSAVSLFANFLGQCEETGVGPCGMAGVRLPRVPRTKLGGRFTEPVLPPRTVVEEGDITINNYMRSGEHGPAHLHVEGQGPSTKIGQAGRPIAGAPELSPAQQAVITANKSTIRKAIDQMQRWFRFENL